MRLPSKLRIRFALWSTTLVFAAIILYGTFVFVTMAGFLHASVKNSLRFGANQVSSSLKIESGRLSVPEHLWEPPKDDHGDGIIAVCLLTPQGQPLLRQGRLSALLPPILNTPSHPYYQVVEPDLWIYTLPIVKSGTVLGIIQVAQSIEILEHMLKQLFFVLAGSLPVFLLGSAASGYFLATRLLRPIDIMTMTARRFSEEDLSARIGLPRSDDELGRLAATFDEMLARIEDSFTRYRQFTADASHELRTPVSVIQAILSVTKRRPRTVEEYQEAMDDLGAAADRLESLVSALITLSRTDMNVAMPSSLVNVSELLTDSADSLRPLAEGKGLALATEVASGLMVAGDSDALIRVFMNVIDNAIKYTVRGSVNVYGRASNNTVEIEVRDTGIGIAKSDLPRIFDRFYRVEQSRSAGGSGLGLAIARSIVERHGGTIGAESSLGVGTLIRIALPAR